MGKLELPPSDEHLRSIGRITVNFALLEEILSLCIRALMKSEQQVGHIITAGLSFKQKVALFSSLYRYKVHSTEEPAELKNLLSRVAQAEEKRNATIHAIWGPGTTKETVTRVKTTAKRSSGLKLHFQEMSVQDLDEIADFIADVTNDVLMSLPQMYDPNFGKYATQS